MSKLIAIQLTPYTNSNDHFSLRQYLGVIGFRPPFFSQSRMVEINSTDLLILLLNFAYKQTYLKIKDKVPKKKGKRVK